MNLIHRDRVNLIPRHRVTGLVRPSGLLAFQACPPFKLVRLSSLSASSKPSCRYDREPDRSHWIS